LSFRIIALGGGLSLTGIFISSFTTSLEAFVFFFGVMSGIGVGITYFIPLICAWEYFPERKGLVTCIIVGAYAFGSFIYIQVATKIVNPHNIGTSIESENQDSIVSFFDEDVANNVPYMWRSLCFVWLFHILLSITMISRPNQEDFEAL